MRIKYLIISITIVLTLNANFSFADNALISSEKGKTIFTTRCTSCHNVNAQIVGPALANVDQRQTTDWIINFVHSPKAMIEKKDKDAVALFNQFNQIVMPDHSDLSADDIKSVLSYIKSETKTSATTEAPFAKPGKIIPNYHPLSIKENYGFFIAYLSIVVLLVLSFLFAVRVKELQRKND